MGLSHLLHRSSKPWYDFLPESTVALLDSLSPRVESEYAEQTVFPEQRLIFRSFELTDPRRVKAVILGQDPYHGDGQANGLAFSVNPGVSFPPSLRNIFKEMHSDLGFSPPLFGDLSAWASSGVLLLNTHLTVRRGEAGSHGNIGWEGFTDGVIRTLSQSRSEIVYILWGRHAQSKAKWIDPDRNCIIASAHPSPLSAYNGFWNSRPFSRANAYLAQKGIAPIDWRLEY